MGKNHALRKKFPNKFFFFERDLSRKPYCFNGFQLR